MGKNIGDSVIRPLLRSLDDMPHEVKKLGGMMRNRGAAHKRNKSDIEGMDNYADGRGPVREFDVGTYKDLKKGETSGDGLQHDHIPSSAALRRARENELGRKLTPEERRELHNDAISVGISDLLHSQSRTYGGRNTQAQVDVDAGNLHVAMERDPDALRRNLINEGRLSRSEINRLLNAIRDMNRQRGIG